MSENISNVKKLFKHSSWYFVGHMLIRFAGCVSLPILTRTFSVEEYGVFSIVSITVLILVAIAKFGSHYSAIRYYSEYKKKGEESVFYTTLFVQTLLFIFVTAGLFLIMSKFLSDLIFDSLLKNLVWFVAFFVIVNSLVIRLMNFIRIEQRIKLYNIIYPIRQYSRIGLGLFFIFFFSKKVNYYFTGQILSDFLIIAILICLIFYKKNRLNLKKFSASLFKKSISYGFPLFLLECSTLIFHYIDRYLIKLKLDTESLGLYTVGANISEYIQGMLFFPISLAILPIYMEMWTNKGKDEVESFLSKTTNYFSILCIPVIFGICMLNEEIVVLLASNKFIASAKVMPFIITGTVIWGFYPIFAAGLYVFKKTKALAAIIFLTSCFNAILNILLIPILGIMGAAIPTFVSYLIMTVVIAKISFKYIKIKINVFNIVKYILASVLMSLIIYNIKIDNILYSLVLKIFIGVFAYSTVVLLIDEKTRSIANRFFRQFFKYKQTD